MTTADLLPHRYPMLLVDRVLDLVDGQEVTAVKAVSVNEPWYARAGSDGFAYPQLLLVESFAQTAGILGTTVGLGGTSETGLVTLIGSVSGARFHRDVFPGDVVTHRVRVEKVLADAAVVSGESEANGAPVLTVAQMVLAFRPESELAPGGESP
ncbi:3-hydroxyacyl-ACP dehydratase FabZ family protein [Amycolatopsis sp. CA-230715]|uniref:3-hydroxyacyl-ACP dehydratase FabZ family protein n=1 Tax=Amycolatopsis sp. CA-230715 TaxID=2745196 RepID=UPI001C019E66|nr:3-hydroxyacyl-ACP dehydratase FabZ family protein [Amycolatopsis sp. CA-230715]QWF85094.1 3-hydroxyacyl-[acyl-carrier-protein] dehydratase FabZ [Amycolatopsis sp. CA-230715]